MTSRETPEPLGALDIAPIYQELSVAYLIRSLEAVRDRTFQALDWFAGHHPEVASVLSPTARLLSSVLLTVRSDLGEGAFRIDRANAELAFNTESLRTVINVARNFAVRNQLSLAQSEVRQLELEALTLFVFHETTHILQALGDFVLVGAIKRAFGPDELSRIDIEADIRAAHGCALVGSAMSGNFKPEPYLTRYRNCLTLSLELLTKAFPIEGRPHKRRRALGLAISITLAQGALLSLSASGRVTAFDTLFWPIYASIDIEHGFLIAIQHSPRGAALLFGGAISAAPPTLAELWFGLDEGPTGRLFGLLMSIIL